MPGRLGRGGIGPSPGPLQGHGKLAAFPWWIHVVEMLLIGLAVILIVLVIVWVMRPRRVAPPLTMVTPALAELDLPYARGELGHED